MSDDKKTDDKGGAPQDFSKAIEALQTQNAALLARLEKLDAKNAGSDPDDKTLLDKVKLQRDIDDQKSADTKTIESALRFSLKSEEFLKNNASILPKDVADIFATAEKEKYASAVEKDAAIKSGIIQSFFSIQANLDLLTPSQKTGLEDYLKLTKNGKQDKAQATYDAIFEPTFEMLKRVKKAEQLNKGLGSPTGSEDAYKKKLMSLSKKHYLGEKQDA